MTTEISDPSVLEPNEENLIALAQKQVLDETALIQGLKNIGVLPGEREWIQFVSLVLQVLGTLFLLSGVVFFFAFNWSGMHKFVKLGLLAGGVVSAAGVAYWRRVDRFSGQVALTAAAIFVGGLLAVYGQIYQTGADSYQLFFFWAMLITAWVIIGRFSPLWIFWILLLNLSLILYWLQIRGDPEDAALYLLLFLLNGTGLLLVEIASGRGVAWLKGRVIPRLLSLPVFGSLVLPTLLIILSFSYDGYGNLHKALAVCFFIFCPVMLFLYSTIRFDPFILLVSAGSLILVTNIWLFNRFSTGTGVFLITSLLIITEAAVVVIWLRRLTVVRGGAAL